MCPTPGSGRPVLRPLRRRAGRALGALVVAGVLGGAGAPPAAAYDAYPCGREVTVPWSVEPVHPCPLTSPLPPNNWVPVYRVPVPNPRGSPPPAPAGWLHSTVGRYFVCHKAFPAALYYHPSAWRNLWWALTRDDSGNWGWVPEVFFKGGDDDEPDYGLRACPEPAPPPPPAPVPTPSPCDPGQGGSQLRIRAQPAGRGRATVTTAYGRRLLVRGRVTGPDGAPRPGLPLCVGNGVAGGVQAVATVTTDATGRFTYQVEPGPTRRVWFVHREGAAAAAASVLVRVRALVGLRATPRALRTGETVLLKGRIGGRPLLAGLLVELQARRGRGWQTFATTRAGRGGAFTYHYRFTRTVGTQVYRLRARVPAQPGYPYAAGGSRSVRVRVSG
jgi:hypothetical protein